MKLIIYFLIIILPIFKHIECQQSKPRITLIRQLNSSSIRLQWAVPIQFYNSLKRYRVQISNDNFINNIQDWPNQYKIVSYDTSDSWYLYLPRLRSNFDCFNECIRDIQCLFVRIKDGECYFKRTVDRIVQSNEKNTQFGLISNYTDDIILNDIPYNELLSYRVSVYTDKWSDLSDPVTLDTRLTLNLSIRRVGFTSALVEWNKTSALLSGYRIRMKYNYAPEIEFTLNRNSYETYSIEPKYDDGRYLINYRPVTRDVCIEYCINNTQCTSIIYSDLNRDCSLKRGNDISKGIFREDVEFLGLNNKATNYEIINQIYSNTSFKFNLEAVTPFGSTINSSELIYDQTNPLPTLNTYVNLFEIYVNLTWSLSESFPLERFSISTSKRNSTRDSFIIEYSNMDYADPHPAQFFNLTSINDCYEVCFHNKSCVSFVWSSFTPSSGICFLKSQKVFAQLCAPQAQCGTIPVYKSHILVIDHLVNTPYCYKLVLQDSYGINSLESKQNCFEFPFKVELINYNQSYAEGTSNNIECVYTRISNQKIKNITWFKDNVKIENYDEFQAESTLNGRYLYFKNISHLLHTGTYKCDVELTTGQVIESDNLVDIMVTYTPMVKINSTRILRFNESDFVSVDCMLNGYPIVKITWKYYFNRFKYVELLDKLMTNVTNLTSVKTRLNLGPIQKTQNGSYMCTSLDGKIFDTIDLLVQTRPSTPEIISAKYYYTNSTIIQWKIVDYGELNLTAIRVEWSKNFSNPFIDINNTVVVNPGENEELALNLSLNGVFIRLIALNILGSSNTSDEFLTTCGSCQDFITYIPLSTQTYQSSTSTQPSLVLIGSITGGITMIIIIFIILIVYFRYCRSKPPQRYDSKLDILSNMKDSLDNSEQVIFSPNKSFVSHYSNGSNFNYSQFFESTYTMESLYGTWKAKIHAIDKELMNEFAMIENPSNISMNEALKPYNAEKSRYRSIFPYDYNRVKLSEIEDQEGSDFINASYIEALNGTRKYIAAQGPTNWTQHDFIRMICEKNIQAIVMLTRLYEEQENDSQSKLKCSPYWNDESNLKIGNYSIQVTYYENCVTYHKRKLMIKNVHDDFIYFVDHYHYTEWYDKQVPCETQSIVSLLKRVNQEHEISHWPILVHCSAGVGRTGTFIALDLLLDEYNSKKALNVYDLIVALRHQRIQLVQTWEQYKFIHVALLEHFLFDDKWISIEESHTKLYLLAKRDDALNLTKMESEYENICSFRDRIRSTTYHSTFTKKFNSNVFKPYDVSLIKLNEDTFVDAVQLKTYSSFENYILASDPNFDTIEVFIRMLFVKKINIIVSLSSQFYLPNDHDTLSISEFTIVNRQRVVIDGQISFYVLEFNDNNKQESIQVVYFDHIKNWPIGELLPINRVLFINFIKKIINIVDQDNFSVNGKPVILVHSNDGGDRCALFVSCSFLFRHLDIIKSFNIIQIVLILRRHRSNMINSFENYKFIYEICNDYAEIMLKNGTKSKAKIFFDTPTDSYV